MIALASLVLILKQPMWSYPLYNDTAYLYLHDPLLVLTKVAHCLRDFWLSLSNTRKFLVVDIKFKLKVLKIFYARL